MSRHPTPVRAGDDRASLYTEITDKIIAELEAGRSPGAAPPATRCAVRKNWRTRHDSNV